MRVTEHRLEGWAACVTLGIVALCAPACSDDDASTDGPTTASSSSTATGSGSGAGDTGGGGGDGGGGGQGGSEPTARLFVTANPADAVVLTNEAGGLLLTHGQIGVIASIQSLALRSNGDGWLTYDAAGGTGGVMVVNGLASQTSGTLGAGSRRIEGPATGLATPRGIEVLESEALVLVSDPGASDIKAFALDATGDATPAFVVDLGGDAAWDTAYDDAGDRLYVSATSGDVLVYDGFSMSQGASGPTRTFSPADNAAKVSQNLHGIAYVPSVNTLLRPHQLVLSDVGDPAIATDGQIFTIADPATATGLEQVRARIFGPLTGLGNPVDIAVDASALGDDVYVAEKANDKVHRFDDITGLTGSLDAAADASGDLAKGESLAIVGGLNGRVLVAANPDGRDADAVVRMLPALSVEASIGDIGDILSVQSATLTAGGDAVLTYDRPGALGGVMVVTDLAAAPDAVTIGGGSRRIEGANTGLVAPKGLFVSEALDAIVVADPTQKRLSGFAIDATGDVGPVWTVTNLGGDRGVWDAAHDPTSDLLFVAGTDGVVLVYEAFSNGFGAAGPTRTITPAVAGEGVSVNLHGIAYLPEDDVLVLSDVGDPMSATDGQLFTIGAASTADGVVDVLWRASGDQTKLGNPVDLSVALGAVYVAEKSNDLVLRFDDILGKQGDENLGADMEAPIIKPESITIVVEANE